MTPADAHRKALAQDLVADLRRLDRALVANAAQIQTAVAASGTTLREPSDVLTTVARGGGGTADLPIWIEPTGQQRMPLNNSH